MSATKHSMTAQIVSRNPNVWQIRCGRHDAFTGPTYESAEDQWREHVYAETGLHVRPLGDKTVPRWAPAERAS